ncbi:MAG: hypothetical protein FJW30_18900 [Acidobacteria bacterium]|nr:hypothetical protein [Acidobacteriota bacterium]
MRSSSHFRRMVTAVFVTGFLIGVFSMRAFSWNAPDEANVNSRYTVESVEISGAEEEKLSKSLREELRSYVGKPFSPEKFGKLSSRVRQELKARLVSPKLVKGSSPENVRVVLDVLGQHVVLDTKSSRFAWHSKLGWTGDMVFSLHEGRRQLLTAGIFSDADTLVERSAGLKAGYRFSMLGDRVRPGISLSTSHAQYDSRTLSAAGTNDLYRSVDSFQPTVVLVPFRGDDGHELTLESGVRLQRFVLESPGPNRNVASHALVNTLRYQRVRGDVSTGRNVVKLSYGLANGTNALSSDYRFRRQEARGELVYQRGASTLSFDLLAGGLDGRSPIRDRFTAGTTRVLRGWSKFELAPLGADRLMATSTEYGHALKKKFELAAFLDSGALWNRGSVATVRNSVGAGLRSRDGFYLYVAFPLREGRMEASVVTGATF